MTNNRMNKFTEKVKAKGWSMKAIGERWGVTPRRMSQIAGAPKQKDWDAMEALPYRCQSVKTKLLNGN